MYLVQILHLPDQRIKALTQVHDWLFRMQPIRPGGPNSHPCMRLLGIMLPTSFLGLIHLTTGNLQYRQNKPIAQSLM